MKPAKPLKELVIVAVVLIGIMLFDMLAAVLFGNSSLDINLHDTYFVVQHTSVLSPLLWFVTIVYIIRTAINHYRNTLQNFILLIACTGLNVLMLNYLKISAQFDGFDSFQGTIYPPLSALGKIHAPKNHVSSFANATEIIFIIEIILLLLLVIIAVLTGKNWKAAKNVS